MARLNMVTMRCNDELKEALDELSATAETSISAFVRGGSEFFCWLWNNKHTDPRFTSLWGEWTFTANKLSSKLNNQEEE